MWLQLVVKRNLTKRKSPVNNGAQKKKVPDTFKVLNSGSYKDETENRNTELNTFYLLI